MGTYFHCAPILLELGSIVLPGNFGRIIRAAGQAHNLWARETALEGVRAQHYPHKPSRWSSCFACPTEATARGYRKALSAKAPSAAWQVLYEVEPLDDAAAEHRADFNVVEPLPGLPHDMTKIAHLYWSAGLWVTIKEQPTLRCEEIVTESPLRILRRLD